MDFLLRHWMGKLCLAGLLVLSLNLSMALADDYFVANNGNDGNRGTIQQPFRTLNRSVQALLPGDTLYVRGGSYQAENALVNIPSGNSWEEPVTIKSYQEEKVVFFPQPGRTVLQFRGGSQYIIIDGIIFDAQSGWHGIQSGRWTHHIRIMNGEIKNAPKQGFLSVEGSAYFELINLRIHDNGTGDFDHGVYISTSNHLVKDCDVYRNAGWGISLYSSHPYKPNNNLIINNKVYDNARAGKRGPGIGVYSGNGNQVNNNIIWGNQVGIDVDWGAMNSEVYNNTIYKGMVFGIHVGNFTSDTKIFNNLISSTHWWGLWIQRDGRNISIQNNLIYGSGESDIRNISPVAYLKGNLIGNMFDPKFHDPTKFEFHLENDSPAIDAGMEIIELTNDFDYNVRPNGLSHDIGAYEKSYELVSESGE